jgi:F-type H+-transporting ATPase subunit delta
MRVSSVARRYARAAFEVAQDLGDPQSWLPELDMVAEAFSNHRLIESLLNPDRPMSAKVEAVNQAFPNLGPEIRNLVKLLINRRRAELMPQVTEGFRELVDDVMGRTSASVVSARPLETEELTLIQQRLNERTGKTVRLTTSVDESLIGGVVIRVGDELIDASVITRLERLRQRLA